MHNFQNNNHFNNNSLNNTKPILNLIDMLDNSLHGATITKLHNHVDIIIIRMCFVKINKTLRSNLFKFKQNSI